MNFTSSELASPSTGGAPIETDTLSVSIPTSSKVSRCINHEGYDTAIFLSYMCHIIFILIACIASYTNIYVLITKNGVQSSFVEAINNALYSLQLDVLICDSTHSPSEPNRELRRTKYVAYCD